MNLPSETMAGQQAIILEDWVCFDCNHRFSEDEKYFANHYHGAFGRVVEGRVGKKGRSPEVARKDLRIKFLPTTNTVQIKFRRKPKEEELHAKTRGDSVGALRRWHLRPWHVCSRMPHLIRSWIPSGISA